MFCRIISVSYRHYQYFTVKSKINIVYIINTQNSGHNHSNIIINLIYVDLNSI